MRVTAMVTMHSSSCPSSRMGISYACLQLTWACSFFFPCRVHFCFTHGLLVDVVARDDVHRDLFEGCIVTCLKDEIVPVLLVPPAGGYSLLGPSTQST